MTVDVTVVAYVVVSLIGRVVMTDVADAIATMVTVVWGGTVYPRTSVHQMVSRFW